MINPLTGRQIAVGGQTHRKLLKLIHTGAIQVGGQSVPNPDQFFDNLLKKSEVLTGTKPMPTKLAITQDDKEGAVIPKSKHLLMPSNLPPAPLQGHSYYHHHAPFAQDFGDYICLKKDTLREVGGFLRDSMFSSIKNTV
jgi:hypothetical protein